MAQTSDNKTFEIGLVMAGAVSAGAYTAGVIDFLLEALEQWELAKKTGDDNVPRHQVKLKVMSGASAGGMTAALTLSSLSTPIEPIKAENLAQNRPINNKLYECWVKEVNIHNALAVDDLTEGKKVRSLLNAQLITQIADKAFNIKPQNINRPYIDEDLQIFLSLANLRGIPYSLKGFGGASGKGHEVSLHADYIHFKVGKNTVPTAIQLNMMQARNNPEWQQLKSAAIATGAFPIGLAPVFLNRPKQHYDDRKWKIEVNNNESDRSLVAKLKKIKPNWPASFQNEKDYRFLCVDGGLMDNEPLELARNVLTGGADECDNASEVNYSTILIDPFPNEVFFDDSYKNVNDDILAVTMGMFAALRNQAMFKPQELSLAYSKEIYSRYLIAPTRKVGDNMSPENYPIASGLLGGFGGFLSEEFRKHDFLLGRRNCQSFLKKYFAIPIEDKEKGGAMQNPIFRASLSPAMLKNYKSNQKKMVPIIPLYGTAVKKIDRPQWPIMGKQEAKVLLKVLKKKIGVRTLAVADRMADNYTDGFVFNKMVKLAARIKKRSVVKTVTNIIEEAVHGYGLVDK